MSGPRVYNGNEWLPVPAVSATSSTNPVTPILDGDGKIFVSIVSYRGTLFVLSCDINEGITYGFSLIVLTSGMLFYAMRKLDGERCGETLKSLFRNAKNPENIVVGLFEQNAPEDKFCLEVYCNYFGIKTIRRVTMRKDVVKVVSLDEEQTNLCPHFNQVRLVAYHHIQAKGPMLARSLVRKVLGNEEFCMQIDAHTEFALLWDELAMSEWKSINNEFGIISNVPAEKAAFSMHGADEAKKIKEVPRQCGIHFMENGFPVRRLLVNAVYALLT
jgi:Glycosyltransferase (GlcNAc)